MDLVALLRERADDLVRDAVGELHEARLEHYEVDGVEVACDRLSDLLGLTVSCLEARRADPIVDWADRVGRERFAAGYELREVQTSINILEEALWRRVFSSVGPDELGRALGLISSVLGMARDTLAQTYVDLASGSRRRMG